MFVPIIPQNMKKVFDLIQREYGLINYKNIKK